MRHSLVVPLVLFCAALSGGGCASTPEANGTVTNPAPDASGNAGKGPGTAVATNTAPSAAGTGTANASGTAKPGDTPPSGTASPGSPAAGCDASRVATWPSCVGKVVTINGSDPGPNVMQHPLSGGPGGATVDLYMDVAGGTQIVLHAKKRVQCQGAMQATGTLRALSLGGPAGTKESYSGYYLDDADVKCL